MNLEREGRFQEIRFHTLQQVLERKVSLDTSTLKDHYKKKQTFLEII